MGTDCALSKRPFAQVASATFSCLHHCSGCDHPVSLFAQVLHESSEFGRVSSPLKRRAISLPQTAMPVQTSPPPVADSFPSFMSVFGARPDFMDKKDHHPKPVKPLDAALHLSVNPSKRLLPSCHRASVSSTASGSTDSSPTTTLSIFDGSSVTDTSGSSSPDSPLPMSLPYAKFKSPLRPVEGQLAQTAQNNIPGPPSDLPRPLRSESPGRRARNLKNLSLTVPAPSRARPSITTSSILETSSQHHLSAPPSPINPPVKTARRRPANLTIRTPGPDMSFGNAIRELIPPTPSGDLVLRHAESSPSLTSVFSPTFGPKAGMQLPRPITHHGVRRLSADHYSSQNAMADRVLHELDEEDDDHLDSRESARKDERGYPDGPIRIYDSGVFLYLEPTAQEASKFDVVVNVAKEIPNPFTQTRPGSGTPVDAWRDAVDSKRMSSAEPQTALSEASFRFAFEYQPEVSSTPTPTQEEKRMPEYFHVGWDHNSEIVDDLQSLCELIDSRVAQGKKVLVHCQLGVSRSASLVIAYGLYKNRHLDFNSMYSIVKERSRWVGPNMSLIYQLTEFRSRLQREQLDNSTPKDYWFMTGPRRSSEPQPSSSENQRPGALGRQGVLPDRPCSPSHKGPSFRSPFSPESLGFQMASAKRASAPRPLPLRDSFQSFDAPFRLSSQRPGNEYRQVTVRDPPPVPAAIFSPRTTEFLTMPLSRTIGGDLAGTVDPKSLEFGQQPLDPRSPPQGSGRLIMRNIDEFL